MFRFKKKHSFVVNGQLKVDKYMFLFSVIFVLFQTSMQSLSAKFKIKIKLFELCISIEYETNVLTLCSPHCLLVEEI